MARSKGTRNKNSEVLPHYSRLPIEERLKFLATLIVDRIESDQNAGGELLKIVGEQPCKT